MVEFFAIQSKALCRLLSVSKTELSTFELAIRNALEAENSEEELQAIRGKACLEDILPIKIGIKGRLLKL